MRTKTNWKMRTVRGFEQGLALEDAIGFEQGLALEDAIWFHAIIPVEALTFV
jgi:hypothetical protein